MNAEWVLCRSTGKQVRWCSRKLDLVSLASNTLSSRTGVLLYAIGEKCASAFLLIIRELNFQVYTIAVRLAVESVYLYKVLNV